MESRWLQEEDIAMSIDCGEEDWRRLHDIRLDGQELEYVVRGKSLIVVGPGSSCYIAIEKITPVTDTLAETRETSWTAGFSSPRTSSAGPTVRRRAS